MLCSTRWRLLCSFLVCFATPPAYFCWRLSRRQGHMRLEGLGELKRPVTSSGIESATIEWKDGFRLKNAAVTFSRYSLQICLQGLRESTIILNQDARCPGSDSNRTRSEYESGALPLRKPARWDNTKCVYGLQCISDTEHAHRRQTLVFDCPMRNFLHFYGVGSLGFTNSDELVNIWTYDRLSGETSARHKPSIQKTRPQWDPSPRDRPHMNMMLRNWNKGPQVGRE
jgi:hypothetical protein